MTDNAQPKSYRYLFGPVPSRRLGLSLGIDLFPQKVCNFNCPYCECGPTTRMPGERGEFVPFEDVEAELRDYLPREGLDFITFAGNGEPTLYSRLADVIRVIREVCDTKIAIITNSATIMFPDIRKELAMADVVMPSLDAVRQDTMHKINRALPSIKADAMVEGLIAFRDEFPGEIDLEIFFCKGLNDDEDEVRLLAEAAAKIRPDAVQINTVHRPGWHKKAVGLTHDEMEAIAAKMREYGAPHVEVIGAFVPHERRPADEDAERQVLSLVSRRAVDAQDMIRSMAMDPSEARGLLNRLIGEGKIRQIEHEGRATFVGPE